MFRKARSIRVYTSDLHGFFLSNRALLRRRRQDDSGQCMTAQAAPGTIRADFAVSIDANAVHGSDSAASAGREIAYFFSATDICARG